MTEMNDHINRCLDGEIKGKSKNNRKSSKGLKVTERKEEENDYDDDDGIETYTVDGETRVRIVSLLRNGYAGILDVRKNTKDDEGDLDVIEEGEYGTQQFGEQDLRINVEDETEKILRERVLGVERIEQHSEHANERWSEASLHEEDEEHPQKRSKKNGKEEAGYAQLLEKQATENSSNLVVEALKEKIKELQGALQNVNKCTVCMGMYDKPLVSINCWHVHCQECWMAALGMKKLCPQCTTITTPSNLRRIFL
eukprot:TRINITY_DN2255_c0_g1_i3.p1 TRINITY_DN2255_c0_g1~~TRINITY_DN2255_c0_g1_i3.p1  ORF type:complete len:254 (-),score=47.08 TRINITY_DN2255_c0_g1_i3:50-811(-)